jgi:hypothetical protein
MSGVASSHSDEFVEGGDHRLRLGRRVGAAVQLVDVDRLPPEPAQAGLALGTYGLGTVAVLSPCRQRGTCSVLQVKPPTCQKEE